MEALKIPLVTVVHRVSEHWYPDFFDLYQRQPARASEEARKSLKPFDNQDFWEEAMKQITQGWGSGCSVMQRLAQNRVVFFDDTGFLSDEDLVLFKI